MKTVIAILAVGSALYGGASDGRRRHSTRSVENHDRGLEQGMQMPPQTNSRCLTAEQAGNLADTFSPRFGGMNTTCQRTQ